VSDTDYLPWTETQPGTLSAEHGVHTFRLIRATNTRHLLYVGETFIVAGTMSEVRERAQCIAAKLSREDTAPMAAKKPAADKPAKAPKTKAAPAAKPKAPAKPKKPKAT
jgi:hypothetical protein